MKYLNYILFIGFLFHISVGLKSHENIYLSEKPDHELERFVLKKNDIRKTFFFNESSSHSILEYEMTYIGKIVNSKKDNLKFIYIATYTGLYKDSKRCKSTIAIYKNGIRYGEYYIGGNYEIIPSLEKSEIVIVPNKKQCTESNRINFSEDMPHEIFLGCKKENGKLYGDIYTLSVD